MTFLLFRGRILTLNSKTLINTKYHMFVIINISSNLLQTLSSFLRDNANSYVTRKWKKVVTSEILRHWKLTSLKNITIFEKKNLTENNNSNNNWKSSKMSKSVTENMSLKWRQQNMGLMASCFHKKLSLFQIKLFIRLTERSLEIFFESFI